MTEDVLAGILSALVEAVHIELPNERVDIPMTEVLGKDLILKIIDLLDGKFSTVSHPMDDRFIVFVLKNLKTLLDKVSD